jgi:hypothetical protein
LKTVEKDYGPEERATVACLNVQTGTENGFVPGYDIFPNPADAEAAPGALKLIPFLSYP